MEVLWHGNTCFTVRDKDKSIVINPDKEAGNRKGQIVLTSLKENKGDVSEAIRVFEMPGEFEMKGIPILAIPASTKEKAKEKAEVEVKDENEDLSEEDKEAEEEASNEKKVTVFKETTDDTMIFYFEFDGIKICHLDSIGQPLSKDTVKNLGDVDILMIDASDSSNLSVKQAMEIVETVDPRVVIPMGSGSLELFLKELGAEGVATEEKFVLKSASQLPDDARQHVVLEVKR